MGERGKGNLSCHGARGGVLQGKGRDDKTSSSSTGDGPGRGRGSMQKRDTQTHTHMSVPFCIQGQASGVHEELVDRIVTASGDR